MSKRMLKALRNKYVYVDIDGTLAEYRFNNHVSAKEDIRYSFIIS